MAPYFFIQGRDGAAPTRLRLADVPSLFCVQEDEQAPPPSLKQVALAHVQAVRTTLLARAQARLLAVRHGFAAEVLAAE